MFENLIDRAKLLFQTEKELRCALHHIIGFYPHNIELYRQALRHRSLHDGSSNERLEFLGDAILDAAVGDLVYHHFAKGNEGKLTQMRSRIVSRESLGHIAGEMGLTRLVRSNIGHQTSHNSYLAGNAFEALVGAIYLDRGYQRCMTFVSQRMMTYLKDIDTISRVEVNHKSKILEWAQKRHLPIHFDITQSPDPDPKKSSPIFSATVIMSGVTLATAQGYSKKQASQEAARLSLEMLRRPETRSLIR